MKLESLRAELRAVAPASVPPLVLPERPAPMFRDNAARAQQSKTDIFTPVRGEILDESGFVLSNLSVKRLGLNEFELRDDSADGTGTAVPEVRLYDKDENVFRAPITLETRAISAGCRIVLHITFTRNP